MNFISQKYHPTRIAPSWNNLTPNEIEAKSSNTFNAVIDAQPNPGAYSQGAFLL